MTHSMYRCLFLQSLLPFAQWFHEWCDHGSKDGSYTRGQHYELSLTKVDLAIAVGECHMCQQQRPTQSLANGTILWCQNYYIWIIKHLSHNHVMQKHAEALFLLRNPLHSQRIVTVVPCLWKPLILPCFLLSGNCRFDKMLEWPFETQLQHHLAVLYSVFWVSNIPQESMCLKKNVTRSGTIRGRVWNL